jgi:hypothetical protein
LKKLLDLDIRNEPISLKDILIDCEKVLQYAVKTGNGDLKAVK